MVCAIVMSMWLFYFVSSTAVVDKAVGNSSCFAMVVTNWFLETRPTVAITLTLYALALPIH